MKKIISILALTAVMAGCANTGAKWTPIIDRPNASAESDIIQCQQHAGRVMSAGQKAVVGAFVGALLGAAASSSLGGSDRARSDSMAIGAFSGAGSGAASGENEQRTIIRNCMIRRGHSVLN